MELFILFYLDFLALLGELVHARYAGLMMLPVPRYAIVSAVLLSLIFPLLFFPFFACCLCASGRSGPD